MGAHLCCRRRNVPPVPQRDYRGARTSSLLSVYFSREGVHIYNSWTPRATSRLSLASESAAEEYNISIDRQMRAHERGQDIYINSPHSQVGAAQERGQDIYINSPESQVREAATDQADEFQHVLSAVLTTGQLQELELLLQQGTNPNISVYGESPLHLAARNTGRYAPWTCEVLLRWGADPNLRTVTSGESPLHVAARNEGNYVIDICEVLLRWNADPNLIATVSGESPLHLAARNAGNHAADICKVLFTWKADPNLIAIQSGTSPLHHAAINEGSRAADICEVLLKHNADPNLIDTESGESPLHLAARNTGGNAPEICKVLLEWNADPNLKRAVVLDGESPLHGAALNTGITAPEICKVLLKWNADPNLKTAVFGESPLHLAARNMGSHVAEICDVLLEWKADPNLKSAMLGEGPLHRAAQNTGRNAPEICEVFLKWKADPNLKSTRSGESPLHLAARNTGENAPEICEVLLRWNADPNLKGAVNGETVFDYAKNNPKSGELLKVLDRYRDHLDLAESREASKANPDFDHMEMAMKFVYRKQESATLGYAGGVIEISGTGASLSVPEGAIPKDISPDITISVHWGENYPPIAGNQFVIGPVIRCQPEGFQFEKPVRLTLPHSAHNITSRNLTIWTKSFMSPRWCRIYNGTVDADDKSVQDEPQGDHAEATVIRNKIKIRVTHFSWFTAILSYFFGNPVIDMHILPYMHPSSVINVERVFIQIYVVRDDLCEYVKDQVKNIRADQCAMFTPIQVRPTGENITFQVKEVSQHWRPVDENQEISYDLVQVGKVNSQCTFIFTKTSADAADISGLMDALQKERYLIKGLLFASTMCDGQNQGSQLPEKRLPFTPATSSAPVRSTDEIRKSIAHSSATGENRGSSPTISLPIKLNTEASIVPRKIELLGATGGAKETTDTSDEIDVLERNGRANGNATFAASLCENEASSIGSTEDSPLRICLQASSNTRELISFPLSRQPNAMTRFHEPIQVKVPANIEEELELHEKWQVVLMMPRVKKRLANILTEDYLSYFPKMTSTNQDFIREKFKRRSQQEAGELFLEKLSKMELASSVKLFDALYQEGHTLICQYLMEKLQECTLGKPDEEQETNWFDSFPKPGESSLSAEEIKNQENHQRIFEQIVKIYLTDLRTLPFDNVLEAFSNHTPGFIEMYGHDFTAEKREQGDARAVEWLLRKLLKTQSQWPNALMISLQQCNQPLYNAVKGEFWKRHKELCQCQQRYEVREPESSDDSD